MKIHNLYKKPLVLMLLIFLLNLGSSVKAEPANITVEGNGNYFVTGQSFPSKITFAGYDVLNKKVYLNYELTTNKITPSSIKYYIQIFDDSSTLIGSLGSYEAPITEALQGQTLSVTNKELQLTGALTVKYNIVITVKEVI